MILDSKAFVYLHGEDDLIIGTCSGPGAAVMDDWEQPVFQLSLRETSDGSLGEIVRRAWSRGRNIPLPRGRVGIEKHMELRGVTTLRKLYSRTKSISPLLRNGVIKIDATHQYGVGSFESIPGGETRLMDSATDEEIGAAVRSRLVLSTSKI
jgi:hypothetical protein